jgi:hypothetical protein
VWVLVSPAAVNYVVALRLLENQRTKRQKTDRLDPRALLGNLESYLHRTNQAEWKCDCRPGALIRRLARRVPGFQTVRPFAEESANGLRFR